MAPAPVFASANMSGPNEPNELTRPKLKDKNAHAQSRDWAFAVYQLPLSTKTIFIYMTFAKAVSVATRGSAEMPSWRACTTPL